MNGNHEAAGRPLIGGVTKPKGPTTSWRALFHFTDRAHLVALVPAVILSALSGVLLPAVAIFMGEYFDALANYGAGTISDHELVHKVLFNTYGLIAVGAATWLLKGGYFALWLVFGEMQAKAVRDNLFQSLLLKDLEWFELRSSGVGSLLSRLQTQIRELQIGTSQPLGFCVDNAVQAVASLGVCFYYSWKITLVTLGGIPLSAIGLSILASKMQSSIIGQELEMAKASSLAINALSSIDTVKCFNAQGSELRQYTFAVKKAAKFYLKQALNNGLQIGFVRFILTSMFVQGFWYGSYLVRKGDASTGTVITTFWSALMATRAWEDALPHLNVLEKGRAAAIALKAILNKVDNGKRTANISVGVTPKFCEGDIEVRNISFAYPSRPDHTILHESTFFFPAGETTFVVGKSGSGKSTLGNILMRFYQPCAGQVFIDGTEIQDLDTNWLRNNITLVPQTSILFNETIMRNIAFGQHDFQSVTSEQVKVCIDLAALQTTISEMPRGINTIVGARGSALSGGQKQRVAIARARLRDTPILILDESTSALDYVNRTLVMKRIREWRRGKTTVVITHDMGQIEDEDFVYVLDGGYVVEEGYWNSLADSGKNGLSCIEPSSPQISMGPHFSSGLVPQRNLSQSHNLKRHINAFANKRSSLEEQDSVDLQLNSIAEDFDHRPYSVSLDLHSPANGALTRSPSLAKAVTSSIKRQSKIQGTSLFSQNVPAQQAVDLLRQAGARGGGTSRPMSMHQAIVMRSIYRQSSVQGRSYAGSPSLDNSRVIPPDISEDNILPPKKQEQSSIKNILKTLWPSLDPKNRVLFCFGIVAVLVHAAGVPAFAYIFSQLLGTFFIKEHQAQKALVYSMLILAVAVVDASACLLSWYLLEAVGEFWVDKLRIDAMARVLDQPKSWFDAGTNTISNITSSLDRNAEEMRHLVGRFMGFVITAAVMMLIAVLWALITCWKLTLVGLAAAPLMYGVTRSYEAVSSRWERRSNEASDATEAIFVEAFGDILTVRTLTLESYFHKKYTKATSSAITIGIWRAIYCGVFFGASDASIHFVTALIFWYGGDVARSHEWSVKAVLIVFTMLLSSTSNATAAIAFVPQIASSIDNGSRLLKLARLPLGTSHEHVGKLKLNPKDPKTLSGPIEFSHLTFWYPSRPEAPALSNLNLVIPGGQCTAIVGSSGSGKSTIASLLLCLYPPTTDTGAPPVSGRRPTITLSGHDIRSLDLPTLRSMISIVPQTPTLFPTSVRANITYGLDLASGLTSLANTEHAARRAGIHDFVASLPHGYETVVGDGGLGLSGGQAQRVVIARALCRRPKILVLDEATSALDGESAAVVRSSVLELVKGASGMTVIIITHARDMMQCADNVVVLEQGRVVEEGGFRELLARKGKLWEMLRVGGALNDR